ncbi:MAG: TetR/AcrR family transcriptional regulator [Solirubrobacteraceae bacterium]|nr:TetR/AcrR family transcriptional regulator [Solirubrobacteraceae bacterium]
MTSPEPADEPSSRQVYQGVRTGGRSARVKQAVLEAAVVELVEGGYAAFSLPKVAERAGVHLSTVHRRWQTKERLILDVLSGLTAGMVPDPKGSSLRADLLELARSVAEMLGEPTTLRLLRAAFVLPDEELDQLRKGFWGDRFEVAQAVVDRAIARGELPEGTDGWDIVEPVHATIWMRVLVTGLPVDHDVLERVVNLSLSVVPST